MPTGTDEAASNLTRGEAVGIFLFNWWQGALLMLAYGMFFAVVGSLILTRRDIT